MKADKTLMNMPVIDLSLDVRELIEKHFTGMFSGEIGVSSIAGGQCAANAALASLDISGYAPVPSFNKFANLAEVHPYPWLRKPHAGSVRSFSSWRSQFKS